MLHYTTLSIKLHHCTLSELKTQGFTLSDVLACVSIHCADQRQHSVLDFLTKSIDNTLQTSVHIANEYLQAYNIGGCVENCYFCGRPIYRFPQTMFQLSIMTILLLSTRNPAICRVNIGSWLQISDTNCILQTLSVVKSTVSSSNTTRRWCQHPLRFHPSVCGFYTKYAAFHLFKFQQEEITGVHDVNVLSFISNYV